MSRHWKSPLLCMRFYGLPQKNSLRREIHWNSSKGSPLFRCRHRKIFFCCCKNVNFFGIKCEELFLLNRFCIRIESAKVAVLLYATNYKHNAIRTVFRPTPIINYWINWSIYWIKTFSKYIWYSAFYNCISQFNVRFHRKHLAFRWTCIYLLKYTCQVTAKQLAGTETGGDRGTESDIP